MNPSNRYRNHNSFKKLFRLTLVMFYGRHLSLFWGLKKTDDLQAQSDETNLAFFFWQQA